MSRRHARSALNSSLLAMFAVETCLSVPTQGPPLALVRSEHEEPRYFISLAGTVLVDWPFPEITPATSVLQRHLA